LGRGTGKNVRTLEERAESGSRGEHHVGKKKKKSKKRRKKKKEATKTFSKQKQSVRKCSNGGQSQTHQTRGTLKIGRKEKKATRRMYKGGDEAVQKKSRKKDRGESREAKSGSVKI